MRYAFRNGDALPSKDEALDTDIREVLPVLHTCARHAAGDRGHRSPADHENRAHRFVEVISGRRFDKQRLDFPCPAAWAPLAAVLPGPNGNGEMGFLGRCCHILGVQGAPAHLPTYEELVRAGTELLGSSRRAHVRVKQAATMYRRARRLVLAADESRCEDLRSRFAPLPRKRAPRSNNLAVEVEAHELLRDAGRVPEEMTAEEMFRTLAPMLAAEYDWWAQKGEGAQKSRTYRELCLSTLIRVAGWIVRAGRLQLLSTMHLDDFFVVGVDTSAASIDDSPVARRRGRTKKRTVSLLEHLVNREAAASLERSTVTDPETAGDGPGGRTWITEAVHADCSRIWAMTDAVYGNELAAGDEDELAHWGRIRARWGRLHAELVQRAVPAEARKHAKNKAKLVRTVTLPQLACVALPLRRREIRELRKVWIIARQKARDAGFAAPDDHPAVVEAGARYFAAAVPNLMLTLALDDGLRKRQYQRGRAGDRANFRFTLSRDAAGRPVGIAKLSTWWTGDRADPARLKIREKGGVLSKREDRDVRWGFVDRAALWDYLSWKRPRELVGAGKVTSLADYDLDADLRSGQYALFVSPKGSSRPEQSRSDLSDKAGEELHYVVRTWVRPELPPWGEIRRDAAWRELWAIHVTRLLLASYWGGVRGDWGTATHLTMDTEETLRKAYTEVAHEIKDRLGLDVMHWEYPHAYDSWMDRLYKAREEIDPTEDPALPMPDGLRARLDDGRARCGAAIDPPRAPRIRRPRPGQAPPRRRAR